jgi:hypothetical protein
MPFRFCPRRTAYKYSSIGQCHPDDKRYRILAKAGEDEEEISRIFDKTQVKLKADVQEQRAVYNSEHIEGMLKILKKNVPVTIQLTTNEPIGISYHMDGAEFAYYMAPYMEEDG